MAERSFTPDEANNALSEVRSAAERLVAVRTRMRELEHSLAVALTVCPGTTIEVDHLPEGVRRGGSQLGPAGDGDRFREELLALLRRHRGNVAEVARAFGKGRMQIHRWARRYDIDLGSFRR